MKLKLWHKKILSILIITIGGFILFNLAFILAAVVINLTMSMLGAAQNEPPRTISIVLYLFIIFLISWFVFQYRMDNTLKATFLTMPLMVILMLMGIIFKQQSKLTVAGIGTVIICAILAYLYKIKLSWLYYYSVMFVATLALYILLSGMEI